MLLGKHPKVKVSQVQFFISTSQSKHSTPGPGGVHATGSSHEGSLAHRPLEKNVSWQKFALSTSAGLSPVVTWAVLRESAHNAPQVERRRGPRTLQSPPAGEVAAQEPRGGRGESLRWLLTRRLNPQGIFRACAPPAVPPSECYRDRHGIFGSSP